MINNSNDLGSFDLNASFRFDNLFGRRFVISEVDPTNVLAGLEEQGSQQKTKATIPTNNTSEAASVPLPLKVYGGSVPQPRT